MRTPSASPLLAAAAAAALASCAPAVQADPLDPAAQFRRGPTPIIVAGGYVRSGASLLDALAFRVPGMQVQRDAESCPRVTLRGVKTLGGRSDPLIYVQDTRALNTCVLEQVSVWDVERVEVFPGGQAGRPGILSSPYGVILVHLAR
ncbi:MAG TPA: TonB-dependent receptor plug domain-containing protein [Longimicrobiaceae bacterium]|nr:TonB-dependent receptor plug domain-containing protein [Longimicrobiaceae bacterium]